MASKRARVCELASSLSHDSLTTNSPATQTPVVSRSSIHGMGETHIPWTTTAADAMEARAANTRMCPTLRMRPGTQVEPPTYPM